MKNAVIGFFMIVILIISGVSIQTAENRKIRKNELDSTLSTAMEQSMKVLTVNPVYHIEKENGTDEFIADFIQGFLMKTTSNSDFTVDILDVDVEKGILDVKVKERYKQIIGYGEVASQKTIILEEEMEPEEEFYKISFLSWGKDGQRESYTIKQVNVLNGDSLSASILPQAEIEKEGYVFSGWELVKPKLDIGILYNKENVGSLYAREDMEFKAVYKQKKG